MKIDGTNWSTPKTNIIAGMNDLRKCLSSGYKARLIRAYNEDCQYPIKKKNIDIDWKCYKGNGATLTTINEIKNSNISEYDKYLTLNYKVCYGSSKAVDRYYNTGELSEDNFRSQGISHIVKVSEMINHLINSGDIKHANNIKEIYNGDPNQKHFFDRFKLKTGNDQYIAKKFKNRLWVVQLLNKNEIQPKIPVLVHILNALMYPLKYVPKKSVLNMNEYKNITYRIGSVTNGFSLQIQIPKKFSFK